ncbi:MAG TPA: CocE/NonD family hydrolase [Actinomycetota bacterium]|nr:CocE/NonD family hydrolase [Actinomycetota bacterium]
MSGSARVERRSRFRLGLVVLSAGLLIGSLVPATGATAAPASIKAVGSVEQVYVTDLTPGAQASLVDSAGAALETRTVNQLGGVLFREVAPGDGYRVTSEGVTSDPVTVHNADPTPWDKSFYDQKIDPTGYQYLTTRDGTKLALTVHPPTRPALAQVAGTPDPGPLPDGHGVPFTPPYPTLIEYSGYAYAKPDAPQSGIAALANAMGFAVVDIQMRGTGCSSGAFDFFEPLQSLDGYDIVETIANQPWVKDHKVGMMGISYGGISQLFTAQMQPPSLAAISPLSVIDATATTLYPGGDLNTGFAVAWANERQHEAMAAGPDAGQPYAWDRIQNGDETCAANQALHPEAADLNAKIAANDHYIPEVADPLDPVTFVNKINVPTFLVCQWQDEQTGGHCPELVEHFTGTDKKWFTFTNGVHVDSLDPETYNRWFDFLQIYVAHEAPAEKAAATHAISPVIYQEAMGLPRNDVVEMPPDPIQALPTYDLAKAEFEKLPEVRVLFENGAGKGPAGNGQPGDPYPAFEASFDSFPVPNTKAGTWYFGPNGSLQDAPPAAAGVDEYTSDPHALPLTNYTGGTGGGDLWGNASQWHWNWKQNPDGTAVSYVSDPLEKDTAVVGSGAVYAWVRSSAPDVDLQATITEVRPDGNETFVQNGYMRASERKLSTDSNNMFKRPSELLRPVPTFMQADSQPMPRKKFDQVAIPLYYEGHVYRAGSRIRVTIAAPNGQQPVWSFGKPVTDGMSQVAIAYSAAQPSALVLPIIPGLEAPTDYPPCPSLRNQPCRPYQPIVNHPGSPHPGGGPR